MPSDAVTMPADASWQTMVQACAVVLSSCLVIGVVLGILHVSCLICILIDAYTLDLSETLDLATGLPGSGPGLPGGPDHRGGHGVVPLQWPCVAWTATSGLFYLHL